MELNEKYLGKKYGRLTIIEVWWDKEKKATMCKCKCDCGNTHISYISKLTSGRVASCGCQRGNKKHNGHGSRLYRIWQAMKTRCLNPNAANYRYYGGKGITVCDEWMNYAPFEEWAKENGYSDSLTIDRKDINKGYCPQNCEWVTMKHQNNHHKSNIYQIKMGGQTYSLRDFVDIIGESYSKIQTQLNRGKITVESLEQQYCEELSLNQYQKRAMTTCMPSSENFSYMMLNLVGEVGEFASKVAKAIRKEKVAIGWKEATKEADENNLFPTCSYPEWKEMDEELKKEAGDILWQLAGVCTIMDWTLDEVAQMNLDKLAARKKAGTIDGSGDGIIRDK